jgi:hypothetical protein
MWVLFEDNNLPMGSYQKQVLNGSDQTGHTHGNETRNIEWHGCEEDVEEK